MKLCIGFEIQIRVVCSLPTTQADNTYMIGTAMFGLPLPLPKIEFHSYSVVALIMIIFYVIQCGTYVCQALNRIFFGISEILLNYNTRIEPQQICHSSISF